MTVGIVDGEEWEWEIEYEEHHIQQLRRKGDSASGSNKSDPPTPPAWTDLLVDVDQAHVKFLGNLTLNLWDCGGFTYPMTRLIIRQDSFMENFLQNQRGDVFSGVALLIYVFDIESRDFPRDLETFRTVLEALYDGSPDARLFCLFHKMDLVQEELRESLFFERETILRQVSHMFNDIVVLGTSIWDETLYKVRSPNSS